MVVVACLIIVSVRVLYVGFLISLVLVFRFQVLGFWVFRFSGFQVFGLRFSLFQVSGSGLGMSKLNVSWWISVKILQEMLINAIKLLAKV